MPSLFFPALSGYISPALPWQPVLSCVKVRRDNLIHLRGLTWKSGKNANSVSFGIFLCSLDLFVFDCNYKISISIYDLAVPTEFRKYWEALGVHSLDRPGSSTLTPPRPTAPRVISQTSYPSLLWTTWLHSSLSEGSMVLLLKTVVSYSASDCIFHFSSAAGTLRVVCWHQRCMGLPLQSTQL